MDYSNVKQTEYKTFKQILEEAKFGGVLNNYYISGSKIDGSTDISGTDAKTVSQTVEDVAGVIIDHHFIDDALNTATKQILGEFTFGASGGLKIITDESNGIWLSPTGILVKVAGATVAAFYGDGEMGVVSASMIVAGEIVSQQIILAYTNNAGDCYIASTGFNAATWDGNGVVAMGIDDSDNNYAKLFAGNISAGKYIKWNGTELVQAGKTVVAGAVTAGENLTKRGSVWPAVIISNGDRTERIRLLGTGTQYEAIVGATGVGGWAKYATKFNPSGLKLDSTKIRLKKVGTPVDNLRIGIQSGSASAPDGTWANGTAFADKAGGDLTTDYVEYDLALGASALQYAEGTYYWVVAERSGGNDNSNYYLIDCHEVSVVNYGQTIYYHNGSSWVSALPNYSFDAKLFLTPTAGKIYYSCSLDTAGTVGFVGFANEEVDADESVPICIQQQDGFSSLEPGEPYGLKNIAGQISVAGEGDSKIGRAINSTTLLITPHI